jgi:RND superfamily putative drug exporter
VTPPDLFNNWKAALAAAVILVITFGSFVAMGLPIVTALLGLGVGISLTALGSHLIQIPDFATQPP